MARRSAESTRALLIDTGIAMLHERGPSAAVAHIKLKDVLDRVQMTTGSAYRIWDDQGAYHRELAIAAVQWRDRDSAADTIAAVEPALRGGMSWQEMARRGAAANLWQFPENTAFLTMLALRASAYGDPELTAASRQRHQEAATAYSEVYQAVIDGAGHRLRAGFRMADFAAAMAALSEGFGVQSATGEPHPHLQLTADASAVGDVDWTLLGVCTVALFERMFEPNDALPVDGWQHGC